MPTIINADTTTGGAIITGDNSGQLVLQSAGSSVATLTSGNLTVTGNVTATGSLGVIAANVTTSGGSLAVAGNVFVTNKLTAIGTSGIAGLKIADVLEAANATATAATGNVNFDVTTQAVLYYTTNASGNWTINLRGSSGTSLNNLMANGESLTAVFLATQGSTAYYNSTVQIDGTGVTPKWQGGAAPTAGNANSVDVYSYTVFKTDNATYTVFASQTRFA